MRAIKQNHPKLHRTGASITSKTNPSGHVVRHRPRWRGIPTLPPCCAGLPEIARSELRIERPHVAGGLPAPSRKREGNRRGSEPFVAVDWDTALDLVQSELRARTGSDTATRAIYGGSYGWASAGRLHHSPSVAEALSSGLHGGFVDKARKTTAFGRGASHHAVCDRPAPIFRT